jgi:hypothetical protein
MPGAPESAALPAGFFWSGSARLVTPLYQFMVTMIASPYTPGGTFCWAGIRP